jgi:hypothetical protein
MAYLQNLTVNKISFVNKAANKRQFVLLKSEAESESESKDVITSNNNSIGETQKMVNPTVTDTANTVSVSTTTPPPAVSAEDFAALRKTNEELLAKLARLDVLEKNQRRSNVIAWLQKECQFLPADINKTADDIILLEDSNPQAASTYKELLQKSSANMQASALLEESGISTTEDLLSSAADNGFSLIAKFQAGLENLRKSANAPTADDLASLVKSLGGRAYTEYRRAHALRAKTQVSI